VTTKEALGIIWTQKLGTIEHPEVDGLIFYGYWGEHLLPKLDPKDFCRIWPKGSTECIYRSWEEDYHVGSIEMHIVSYPSSCEWLSLLESSMKWFTDLGAIIVWCGGEVSSQSIESLGPDGRDGLVYAGYSSQTGLLCLSGLNEEVKYLGDAESDRLWKVIKNGGVD